MQADDATMHGLNWGWIALQLTIPSIVGIAIAFPFWRRAQPIFGNLLGTAVMFGAALGLILREYVEIDRVVQQCLDEGRVCFPEPSAFTRFAIYAFIALAEVFVLFSWSLSVDHKARRRDYAPEWR